MTETNQDDAKLVHLIERLVKAGNNKQFHLFFLKYHEADIADALETLPSSIKQSFFQIAQADLAVDVLEEMNVDEQLDIITKFKTDLAATYIEQMEPDDAVDLIEELFDSDEQKAQDIIEALPQQEAEDIKELLAYNEDSAGAIMTTEFLSIPENLTVKQALAHIKKQSPPKSEVSFYVYIIDEIGRLKGYTTLRDLLMEASQKTIKMIRNDNPKKASVDTDQEEVAKMIQKYNLVSLPIINDANILVGIVTVDDVVDIFVDEATEDIYKLSGTAEISELKLLEGKLIYPVASRLPWLFITIFGGIAASLIITKFSTLYDQSSYIPVALILSFVPLLMGLGGNVGNQTATIIVRGLSTGHVKKHTYVKTIGREIMVGLFISAVVASAVYACNYIVQLPANLSLIVSISLIANITVAASIGAALPLIFKKIGVDPAVASAPFISTTLDIISQLIYFLFIFILVQ